MIGEDIMDNLTSFSPNSSFPILRRDRLEILQVNLGYRCNQQCSHCHVNAGPHRNEMMDQPVIDQIIDFLNSSGPEKLDLTGGAPELNPYFRHLVHAAREGGVHVMDRCNLTIFEEDGQNGLEEFLADHQVEIIASLPCYLKENVDQQRGEGVFEKSIRVLKRLNQLGYGREDSKLQLNLVYNPLGAFLPPSQKALEEEYRKQLGERYGIMFNHLYTLTNMPIGRFRKRLMAEEEFEHYMALLKKEHRQENLDSVMCRSTISIDWQGYLYDCDFNQMLGLPLQSDGKRKVHLTDLKGISLEGNGIEVSDHCFGCTASQGSSCGGALI